MTDKRLRYVVIEKETGRLCADGDSIIESDDRNEIISFLATIIVSNEDYKSFTIYDNKQKKELYVSTRSKKFSKLIDHAFMRHVMMQKTMSVMLGYKNPKEFLELVSEALVNEAKEGGRK